MSGPLLVAVAFIYFWVALENAYNGRYGIALAWAAYAVANVGFALDLRRG